MPVYRITSEGFKLMKSSDGLNWVPEPQRQHDGSFILQCSRAASQIIGGGYAIELQYVCENKMQELVDRPDFYDLARKYGNWSALDYIRREPKGTPEMAEAEFLRMAPPKLD